MLGAILGDIVGSPYEFDHNNYKHKDFSLLSKKSHFTDDTVMTVAVARGLIAGKGIPERTFEETKSEMRIWGETYPHAGYGGMFRRWLHAENPKPYGSFGNGSAMRVSAAGWLFDTLDKTLEMAKVTAEVTHNHPEGIKGAQATAAVIFLARTGHSKPEIKHEKERVPLSALRGQRVLLPSLRQDLFSPLWDACAREGFAPNAEIGPSFYQAYYLVQEQLCTCLTRYEPGARRELDRVRDVLLEDLPPLCVSMVQRRDHNSAYLDLLRGYLMEVIGGAASLPPRRGRPAKPFYNFPVLSSAAPKAAPQHPAPGTQLPFAGGNNFRELGGYEADEGKHVKWGQIYRGIPTGLLTGAADRKLLDSLGLRLILDLRSESEAAEQPDYVPDGARLVRICGLCHPDGSEISFSPGDIEKLLKGKKDEEHNLADAMYEQMLFRNKAYKELFRALEAGETPILFHCSGGKDRTGVAAMLILLALGASDETICQDFVRTNVCRRPELEKIWAAHAEEIEAHPEQKQFYQGIAGVHPESAPFVLDTIRKEYGTTDAYLEAEYGLTPARLMRLRRMYLE